MSSSSRQQLEDWLKTIEVKCDSVLDVGGSAGSIKGRLKSFDCKNYKIMDNNNEKELHKKWIEPDFEWDINEKLWKIDIDKFGTYDVIFMIEVFEYLYDPLMVFRNIHKLLNTGGKLYFSCHFIYPIHCRIEDDNLRITRAGIIDLLARIGFKEWKITPRLAENPNELYMFFSHERMRSAKGYDHREVGYCVEATK